MSHQPHQPPHPDQEPLPLDLPHELLMQEAERRRLSQAYWRQRYRTLEALLADPVRAHVFMTCARHGLRARLRQQPDPKA